MSYDPSLGWSDTPDSLPVDTGAIDTGSQTVPTTVDLSGSGATSSPTAWNVSPAAQDWIQGFSNSYAEALGGAGTDNPLAAHITGDNGLLSGDTVKPFDTTQPTSSESLVKRMMDKFESFAKDSPKTADLVGSSVLAGLGELLTGANRKKLEISKQMADAATTNANANTTRVAQLGKEQQNALSSTGTALAGYQPVGSQVYNPVAAKKIQNQGLVSTAQGV